MKLLFIRTKIVLLMLVMSIFALNVSQATEMHHPDHKAALIGTHGMAVFSVGDKFYASHMPLYNSIHAHQIVFEFDVSKKVQPALRALLTEQDLVTLLPERFDLALLMNGELKSLSADLYAGHFERGGTKAESSLTIAVVDMVLLESLKAVQNGYFYQRKLGNKTLLIHRIGQQPSFDQILVAEEQESSDSDTLIELGQTTPIRSSSHRSLYLETQDFAWPSS